MFTLGDVLMISFIAMMVTSILSILTICLAMAKGNKEREAEAYRRGFYDGRLSELEEEDV